MLMTWTQTVKWLSHTSWTEVSEVTQETLNISLCHSPLTGSRRHGAGKHWVGNLHSGLESTGCSCRAWHMDRKGEAVTDWEATETFGCEMRWRCPTIGTPRQQLWEDASSAALSMALSQSVPGQEGSALSSCPKAPSTTSAIERPADKMPYNLNHGSEQTKGEWWTQRCILIFQCLLLCKFQIFLSRLKTFTKWKTSSAFL